MGSTEYELRLPHTRTYTVVVDGSRKTAVVDVSEQGVVSITEEALHNILTLAGFTETTADHQGAAS